MNAIVNMEEKYESLNISYINTKEKELIFKINELAIQKFSISPELCISPKKPGLGNILIEFIEHDRMNGYYFEFLIKELNLIIL